MAVLEPDSVNRQALQATYERAERAEAEVKRIRSSNVGLKAELAACEEERHAEVERLRNELAEAKAANDALRKALTEVERLREALEDIYHGRLPGPLYDDGMVAEAQVQRARKAIFDG